MKKIKVLFVVDKSGFGGIQTIASNLFFHNSFTSKIDFELFFLRDLNNRYNMEHIKDPKVHYSHTRDRYSLLSLVELIKLVKEEDVNVLHLNGNKAILYGSVLHFLFPHIKIIAHEHGGVFDYSSWYYFLLTILQNNYDLFVCLSENRKNQLLENAKINGSKIKVLPNFVDTERFKRKQEKIRYTTKKESLVIGYLGGLSYLKGWHILINALPMVIQNIPKAKLLIAGDGPDKEKMISLIRKLKLENSVDYIGLVSKPEEVYPQFDIYVMPSLSEAGPMALFEAQALGVPVITSDIPIFKELVDENTGLMFRKGDSQHLAETIISVQTNISRLEQIAANAEKLVKKEYSLDSYCEKLEHLYDI